MKIYKNKFTICFKTRDSGNVWVNIRDKDIGPGSYEWYMFEERFEHTTYKWAKLHGYVDIVKRSVYSGIIDWKYYGQEK